MSQYMKGQNPGYNSNPMQGQGMNSMNAPGNKNFVGGMNPNSNQASQQFSYSNAQFSNPYGGGIQVPLKQSHHMGGPPPGHSTLNSAANSMPPIHKKMNESTPEPIGQFKADTSMPPPVSKQQMSLPPPSQSTQPQSVQQPPQPVQTQTTTSPQTLSNTADLANTKEKTPMCLVNELARFNKIQHQYTLIDEQGPAHKKLFTVKLKLGEEEYTESGPSIKKAQHSAAAIALEDTKLKHPPNKQPRPKFPIDGNTNTPTVELNALAMKRGEQAFYRSIEPRYPNYYPPQNFDYRGMYSQRPPRVYCVSLKVGQREFFGEGPTRQAARHNAATKAVRILKSLPLPEIDSDKGENSEATTPTSGEDQFEDDDLKSEISLVHEIALKRNMSVSFEVIRETGPPHMKNFVTRCAAGDIVTEGEGNSKRLSKKHAAERILEELKKLPPMPQVFIRPRPKVAQNKKKSRNLIKVEKADPAFGVGINPISRLIQIMQAQKKKEPVYSLLAERGLPRRREFVMKVEVEGQVCNGVGPNKKLAKRNAAEAMLQLLGYNQPAPQPAKPSIKSGALDLNPCDNKKVTFIDNEEAEKLGPGGAAMNAGNMDNRSGGQLRPGLILVPNGHMSSGFGQAKDMQQPPPDPYMSMSAATYGQSMRPDQQLREIARHNNIQVQYDDFPKSNSNEFLTRVYLSTNPPKILTGRGLTQEDARDDAALAALRTLLELNVISTNAVDGSKMTTEL